jgi:hypothetical protein
MEDKDIELVHTMIKHFLELDLDRYGESHDQENEIRSLILTAFVIGFAHATDDS